MECGWDPIPLQESLTLAAVWVIGEYSEILLEGGIVDEEQPRQVG